MARLAMTERAAPGGFAVSYLACDQWARNGLRPFETIPG